MKIKKAMLIFPSNVLICYDLYIIDLLNRFKSKIDKNVWEHCVDLLLEIYNSNITNTPLHKLEYKYGRLKLVDLMTGLQSEYTSLNRLIYGKPRFITIEVYEYLIKNGYRDILSLGSVNHRNVNCDKLMEQYNNFIVYDNRNWDERSLIQAIYGGSDENYIDRDKLMEWFDNNISPDEDEGLELTFVSDAFDIDRELAIEAFHTLGMRKSKYIQTEMRMCCMNADNMRRYNESNKREKDYYRSSIGLFKLWDHNAF